MYTSSSRIEEIVSSGEFKDDASNAPHVRGSPIRCTYDSLRTAVLAGLQMYNNRHTNPNPQDSGTGWSTRYNNRPLTDNDIIKMRYLYASVSNTRHVDISGNN